MYFKFFLNGKSCWSLLDPGAGICVLAQSLATDVRNKKLNFNIVTANGNPIEVVGVSRERIHIGDVDIWKDVVVSSDIPDNLFILGNCILKPYNLKLDYELTTFELRGSGKVIFQWGDQHPELEELRLIMGKRDAMERYRERVLSIRSVTSVVEGMGASALTMGQTTENNVEQPSVSGPSPMTLARHQSCPNDATCIDQSKIRAVEGMDMIQGSDSCNQLSRGETMGLASSRDCQADVPKTTRCEESLNIQSNETFFPGKAIETLNGEKVRMAHEEGYPLLKIEAELFKRRIPNFARVAKTMCLEPNSKSLIKLSLGESIKQTDYVIVPKISAQLIYGIFARPTIVRSDYHVIEVWNLTDSVVSLVQGLRIGEYFEFKECKPETVNSLNMGVTRKPEKFDIKYFNINPNASPEDRKELEEILRESWDLFAFSNYELGSTDIVEHSIDTGDAKPVRQRLWTRYSKKENEYISQQVQEMLDCGVIVEVIALGFVMWYLHQKQGVIYDLLVIFVN